MLFGVYSATTAQITASGKIGFVAHGCNVDITGTIKGHAAEDKADGIPVTTPENLGSKVEVRGDAKTLSIGSRYFSDMESTDGKPADIVIVLTVKNVSNFAIEATLNDATKTPSSAVTITKEPASETIASQQEVTFTITLSLEPTDGEYAPITMPASDNLELSMEFDRAPTQASYNVTVNNNITMPSYSFNIKINGETEVKVNKDTTFPLTYQEVQTISFYTDEGQFSSYQVTVNGTIIGLFGDTAVINYTLTSDSIISIEYA